MHPTERLRHVARSPGIRPSLLVREAAAALASLDGDPAAMVTACKRLVDRHPASAPVWWLAARVLVSAEPAAEALRAAHDLDADRTPRSLADAVPEEATVVVLGSPEQVGDALCRRGDVEVLLVDCRGEAAGLAHDLQEAGVTAVAVPDAGLGAAVAEADLVLLEASAFASQGFVSTLGARAAAALGRSFDVPVWVAAGTGRVLPGELWELLAGRLEHLTTEPWDRLEEIVPSSLCDRVVGPSGLEPPGPASERSECPMTPELLGFWR